MSFVTEQREYTDSERKPLVVIQLFHIAFGSLDVLTHIGMIEEIWWSLRNDGINLGIEDRISKRAGHNHEHARTEHIVIVGGDKA